MKRIAGLVLAASTLAVTPYAHAQAPAVSANTDHAAQTAATRKLAMAFLDTYFIKHDFSAYAQFATPDFIQHDPSMADGVEAQRAYMNRLFAMPPPTPLPPPQAHVIDMVLVDGDLFAAMHHAVNGDDSGRLFVDIWRVEDGKIAEHWDVIQPFPMSMPHGNGMGCGFQTYAEASKRSDSAEHPACGNPDPNITREQSLANYRAYTGEVGKGDVVAAIDKWFSPDYKQHSPVIADGKKGAIDYLMQEWGKKDAPKPILGPQRIIAEGDFVMVHYMYRLEGVLGEEAHIDVFRFKDGKISEHWDLKQVVPATTASGRPMW